MKKIVFIEKEENASYDPVSTFIQNKKSNSAMKAPTNISKKTDFQKKLISAKTITKEKQKYIPSKIGRKGDHLPPKNMESKNKEQTIYDFKKNEMKRANKTKETDMRDEKVEKTELKDFEEKIKAPTNLESVENSKLELEVKKLTQKIKKLEEEKQLLKSSLSELQQKEEKWKKMEQKLIKVQKQHKVSSTQIKNLIEKLKNKEEQIKVLMKKDDISYSKKRQIMLMNQMNQVKKINRQLVARIKNYKGTDLVQLSIQNNKSEILNQFDNPLQDTEKKDYLKIESICFRLSMEIQNYLKQKNGGKDIGWGQQKKMLVQLSSIAKQLSLECLNKDFRMPENNEECIGIFDTIEKYQKSMEPILQKYQLNLIIPEENIQLLSSLEENKEKMAIRTTQFLAGWKCEKKKFKKGSDACEYYYDKCSHLVKQYQKWCNFYIGMIGHCIGQIGYTHTSVGKWNGSLREQLNKLQMKLKELEQIAQVGEHGKESIYFFLQQNLPNLLIRIPKLHSQMKQVGSIFKHQFIKS